MTATETGITNPSMDTPRTGVLGTAAQARFELAKWIALAAMTVDHYGKIVEPALYFETNAIGRLTFPLLAWIIASRLAMEPGLWRRYLPRLTFWALVSQPVFVFVGKGWTDPNIFFTLVLGVAAFGLLHEMQRPPRLGRVLLLALVMLAAPFVDYGIFGVLMVPGIAAIAAYRPLWGALAAGPWGVLGNLMVFAPYFGPGGLCALAASAVAMITLRFDMRLPRLPRDLFYAYYPAHLLMLYALASALR